MTQFQHTLRQLLLGEKTETSRRVLQAPDGATAIGCEMIQYPMGVKAVMRGSSDDARWIARWIVGRDYAIQPERTAKSIGRYRLNDVWLQDVRTLTLGQVDAEGFSSGIWIAFWEVWCKMHDKPVVSDIQHVRALTGSHVKAQALLMDRPAERYLAWRMSISVLWDTIDWDAPAIRALQIEPKSVY